MWKCIAPSLCLVLLATACETTGVPELTAGMEPAETYIGTVIERVDYRRAALGDIIPAAEAAAARIVNGGRIYVTDDETISRTGEEETMLLPGGDFLYPMHEDWGGFVAEACDRAGGLRHIQPVPVSGHVTGGDVVLVGTLDLSPEEQRRQVAEFTDTGALVIVFGSRESAMAQAGDYLVDNGLRAGVAPVMEIGAARYGPVANIANVINLWVFTAEFAAACTRLGEMPAFWESMFLPGAAEWNRRIGDFMFHPDSDVPPVGAGELGEQYCRALAGHLTAIRDNELAAFAEAGSILAGTINRGDRVVASLIGHFMRSQQRMPGYPELFVLRENEYGTEQFAGAISGSDTWLHIGYSYTPEDELAYLDRLGTTTVCVFTEGPTILGEGEPVPADYSLIDVYIDPSWRHGDAAVSVPAYGIDIIPPSGVVMVTCYWMLLGETLARLE